MAAAGQVYSTTVTAAGTATVSITTGTAFQTWRVDQVSVEMPAAPVGATCVLRKQGALITPLIPTGDAAAGDPPITLRPGQTLTVEFAGCTPADVGTVYLMYDDGRPE